MPASRLVRLCLLLLPLWSATGAEAQQATMPRAFELERRGNYEAAAEAYRGILSRNPGDVSALLGLERVLLPLNQSVEIVPEVRAALAARPIERGPVWRRACGPGVRPTSRTACARWPSAGRGSRPGTRRRTGSGARPPWRPASATRHWRHTGWGANAWDAATSWRPSWPSSPSRTATTPPRRASGFPRSAGCPAIASPPWPPWAMRRCPSVRRSCGFFRPTRTSRPAGWSPSCG